MSYARSIVNFLKDEHIEDGAKAHIGFLVQNFLTGAGYKFEDVYLDICKGNSDHVYKKALRLKGGYDEFKKITCHDKLEEILQKIEQSEGPEQPISGIA